MKPISEALQGRVFTAAEAADHGVTRRMLGGDRFRSVQSGVFALSQTELTQRLLLDAAFRVLPADAAVSHLTNLQLRGFQVGPRLPLHFSTNAASKIRRPGVVVHRRQGSLNPTEVEGLRSLGAMRTFVDAATMVNDRNLLRVGDWLATTGQIDVERLRAYVRDSHLDGVVRARRVAACVRPGAASPRESDLRWYLAREALPDPSLNHDIFDDHGAWLARGDLVYFPWRVLVEYDGWQHERDAGQRQWDHLRRERLEAAGWRVIVITAIDMGHPTQMVARVRSALVLRGWTP